MLQKKWKRWVTLPWFVANPSRNSERLRDVAFCALLTVPLLLLFYRVPLQGYLLEGMVDRREYMLPFHYLNLRAFQDGQYPQWNAFHYDGAPLAWISLDIAWSPLNWPLYFWGNDQLVPIYSTWLQILKQLLTIIFAYMFFRAVIARPVVAALAAAAYAWSAPAIWVMITGDHTFYMFFPLGMLLLFRSREGFRIHQLACLSLILAIEIAGSPLQWSYYLWIVWLVYAAYLTVPEWRRHNFKVNKIPAPMVLFASATAIAGLLAAPKIIPFVFALLRGDALRGQGLTIAEAVQYSRTPIAAFLRLIASNVLGYRSYSYWDLYPLLLSAGPAQNYVETMLANAGVIPIALTVAALFSRTVRREAKFPLAMILAILLILPGSPLTYVFVALTGTGLKYSRLAAFLPLFIGWAAALVLARELELTTWRALTWAAIVVGASAVIGFVAAFLAIPRMREAVQSYYLNTFYWSLALLAAVAVAAVGLFVCNRKGIISSATRNGLLVVVTVADLFASASIFGVHTYNWFLVPGQSFYASDASLDRLVADYARSQDFRLETFRSPLHFTASPFPTANSNIVYGLPQASGFSSTLPRRYMEFAQALGGAKSTGWFIAPSPALDKLSAVRWRQISDDDQFRFEPVAPFLARARLVGHYRVASDADALQLLRTDALPDGEIVLREKPASPPESSCTQGQVTWEPAPVNGKILNVEVPAACLLYIADSLYPGWSVTVDGAPARLLSANYMFMAVEVAPGKHRIALDYVNPDIIISYVFVAIGLIILLAATLVLHRVGKRPLGKPLTGGSTLL
ncbi:MAG: hypothetical protein EXR96_05425 [Nitrospiraceae bacterium]|nr:hypothetical protein [Nitrospiraceae bacterium]